jgi:hypothetical protein
LKARLDPPARGGFKMLRILVLLLVLLAVALTTWLDRYRSTRWREPLYVSLYPVAADDSAATSRYLMALDAARFHDIDLFFQREAARHRLHLSAPVKMRLRAQLHELPPHPPDGGVLATALWSLQLRFWAWRMSGSVHEPEDIRIFVLYHDPALTRTVPHSLGLTKGLIGVVYAFAAPDMDGGNSVVIAHELLHTVGASDKYVPGNDAPRFPDGYGDPHQQPLYPQTAAEVMAGRRMLSADRWQQAESLDEVVIGDSTAREIRWPAD